MHRLLELSDRALERLANAGHGFYMFEEAVAPRGVTPSIMRLKLKAVGSGALVLSVDRPCSVANCNAKLSEFFSARQLAFRDAGAFRNWAREALCTPAEHPVVEPSRQRTRLLVLEVVAEFGFELDDISESLIAKVHLEVLAQRGSGRHEKAIVRGMLEFELRRLSSTATATGARIALRLIGSALVAALVS